MSIQNAFLEKLLKTKKLSEPEAYVYLCAVANDDGIVEETTNSLAKKFRWGREKVTNFLAFLASNGLACREEKLKICALFSGKNENKNNKIVQLSDNFPTENRQETFQEKPVISDCLAEPPTESRQLSDTKQATIHRVLTEITSPIYLNLKYIYYNLFLIFFSSLRDVEKKYIYSKYENLVFGRYEDFSHKNNIEFKEKKKEFLPFKTFTQDGIGHEVFFTDGEKVVLEVAEKYPCDEQIEILKPLKAKQKIIVLFGETGGPKRIDDITFYHIADKIKYTKRSTKEYVNYFLNMRKEALNGNTPDILKGDWPSIMSNFKRLLETYGDDMLQDLIDQYFRSTNSFYAETSYAPHVFYSQKVIIGLIGQISEDRRSRKRLLQKSVKYNGYYWRKDDCAFIAGFGYVPIDELTNKPETYAICKISDVEEEE